MIVDASKPDWCPMRYHEPLTLPERKPDRVLWLDDDTDPPSRTRRVVEYGGDIVAELLHPCWGHGEHWLSFDDADEEIRALTEAVQALGETVRHLQADVAELDKRFGDRPDDADAHRGGWL